MIPLIRQFMPSASTGAKPHADGDLNADSQKHAWKREMERVQSESWFKARSPVRPQSSPVLGAIPHRQGMGLANEIAATHEPTPGQWRAGMPPAHTGSSAPYVAPVTARSAPDLPHTEARTKAAPSPQTSPVVTVYTAAPFSRPLDAKAANTLGKAVGSQHSTKPPALIPPPIGQRAPVRMHAQWEGDTVAIWLGIDADHVAHATQLVDTLHSWLHSQGLRATSIVCNGQPVGANHHFHITATRET